jgi:hypothetical protein
MQLWAVLEADIGDCFETYEVAAVGKDGKLETDGGGKMLAVRKQRPRLLSDLPPELRKAIEHVQVDARGNVVPQLYSKAQANKGLRELLNIGRQEQQADANAINQLSDAELIAQLSDMAKQLGVDINLNYSFAQPPATAPQTDTIDAKANTVEADKAAGASVASGGSAADAADAQ